MSTTNLSELTNLIYPNVKGIRKIQKKGRFYFLAATNRKAINAMVTVLSRENLKPILTNNPDIMVKALKPYLCANWSRAERTEYLTQHYLFLDNTFGEYASVIASDDGVSILEFESLSGQIYRIQLYRGAGKEGSIGIRLIDDKNRSIYVISCNISGTTTKTMHIGMLQGASDSIKNRHALIKELTKSLHGLRTKSLLVEMALMLARVLGVDEVKAISNKGHVYQAPCYMFTKRHSITFDYDSLWGEFEAIPLDPYFFGLPVFTPRKDPLTLKKTKRKMYTKRYQWLDESEVTMAKNLAPWLMNPPAIQSSPNVINGAIDSTDNAVENTQAA